MEAKKTMMTMAAMRTKDQLHQAVEVILETMDLRDNSNLVKNSLDQVKKMVMNLIEMKENIELKFN